MYIKRRPPSPYLPKNTIPPGLNGSPKSKAPPYTELIPRPVETIEDFPPKKPQIPPFPPPPGARGGTGGSCNTGLKSALFGV